MVDAFAQVLAFLTLSPAVFWTNIGLSHPRVQAGNTLSTILTIMLCIFWTVPVGFISGLSSLGTHPALDNHTFDNPALDNHTLISIDLDPGHHAG